MGASSEHQKVAGRLRRRESSSRPVATSVEHNSCRQRVLAGFSPPDLLPQLSYNVNEEVRRLEARKQRRWRGGYTGETESNGDKCLR